MMERESPTKESLQNILRYKLFFESEQPKYSIVSQSFDPYLYSDEVRRFIHDLYDESIVISFDWTQWTDEADKYVQNPKRIRTANLTIIRKLFTTILRKDRFSSGTVAKMIDENIFSILLNRLETIVSEME